MTEAKFTIYQHTDIDKVFDDVRQLCDDFWSKNADGAQITIEPIEGCKRSVQQNKALWGCAYEKICEVNKIPKELKTAYKDKLHTYFCGQYFGWKFMDVMGQKTRFPLRTTTTNEMGKRDVIKARDFIELYEFIQATCAQGSPPVQIPDPDPKWKENLLESDDQG